MRYSISATRSFASRHRIEDHPTCNRGDGHTYHVRATITYGELDDTGYPRGSKDLQHKLEAVVYELDHRDLDEMLPGLRTTPPRLAAWFTERLLSIGLLAITKVEVWNEDESGTVDIESRRA